MQRWASSTIRDLLQHAQRPDIISLAGGLPANELLPVERLSSSTLSIFEQHGSASLQYGVTAGEPALRELLASFECVHPDDLVVTTGSQQALDLVARTLAEPGDVVVVDDPGYVGALQVLRGNGLTLQPCPVDRDGLDTDTLEAMLVDGLRPRFVYTNPNHQNPTGASLSEGRRRHLLELAERHDLVVVADDPYRELTFDGPVPLPEEGLHPTASQRVILLGSLSKTLSPGLRLGWCSGPTELMRTVVIAKQAADLHTPTLNQMMAAATLSDHGWWIHHLQGLRRTYRARCDALCAAVERHLDVAFERPTGGFFLWLDLAPSGVHDTDELLGRSLDAGVAFVPGSAFTTDSTAPSSALRLSYSLAEPERFDDAIRRLASLLPVDSTPISGAAVRR